MKRSASKEYQSKKNYIQFWYPENYYISYEHWRYYNAELQNATINYKFSLLSRSIKLQHNKLWAKLQTLNDKFKMYKQALPTGNKVQH